MLDIIKDMNNILCSWSSRNAPSNAWFSVSSSQFLAFVLTFSSFNNSSSFVDLSRSAASSLFCHTHKTPFCTVVHQHIIRYDTKCYFNVRSKADMSRLIYRTETTTKNCKTEKLKSKNSLTVRKSGGIM